MASVASVMAVFCLGILRSHLPWGSARLFGRGKAVAAWCSHLTGITCLGLNDALSPVTWPPDHGFSNLTGITSSWFTPLMNLLLSCVCAASPHAPLRITSAVLYVEEVTVQENQVISIKLE